MFLQNYEVKGIPERIFYIPNFISENEETNLINYINNSPKPKWTQLAHRRLQNWGGLPHAKGMIAEDLPKWLSSQVDKIAAINGLFESDKRPNHVLINEYLPGQGIMPHTDGPLFHPIVTTINCGSHTVLDFYKPRNESDIQAGECERKAEVSLLLERRSLVVVQETMYQNMLHGISEHTYDIVPSSPSTFANLHLCANSNYKEGEKLERGTRLSLTIRHVPKTKKLPGLFNFK